jgi:hypothetical protein
MWSLGWPTLQRSLLIALLIFASVEFASDAVEYVFANILKIDTNNTSSDYLSSLNIYQKVSWFVVLVALFFVVFLAAFSSMLKAIFLRRRWVQLGLYILLCTCVILVYEIAALAAIEGKEEDFVQYSEPARHFIAGAILFQEFMALIAINFVFSRTCSSKKLPLKFRSDVVLAKL